MRIDRHLELPGTPDALWAVMQDVPTVVSCFPGARLLAQRDDGALDVAFTVRVGPTRLELAGHLQVDYREPERHVSLIGQGADPRRTTRVAIESLVVIGGPAPGPTNLTIAANLAFAGPLAAVVDGAARALTGGLLTQFGQALGAAARKPRITPAVAGDGA